MRSVVVLGAGMIGVSTALHLQRRGIDVVLVDRRAPGEETSHGNAGIIQSEAIEPYAMPRDVPTLTRVALGLTNDVRYRVAALPAHAGPLARYWWTSRADRHARIAEAHATLIAHAVPEHEVLIAEAGAEPLVRRDGYLVVHRDHAGLAEAVEKAERIRTRWGVPFRALSRAETRVLEPSLSEAFVGALHWTSPWTVSDPGGLVKRYGEHFVARGGGFVRGEATSLTASGAGWTVRTEAGPIEAEAVVVALGPWSPNLLAPFGYRFPMVRKRGYHRHFAGGAPLVRPVFDTAAGYVVAPMVRGLRITTGAEFTGPDAPATPVQLGRAERAARELLDLGGDVDPDPWFGTRPFLAGMLPLIGEAPRHPGLWFNFGHGHQGFTLGPVSGRLLAETMCGETPSIADATPFLPRP